MFVYFLLEKAKSYTEEASLLNCGKSKIISGEKKSNPSELQYAKILKILYKALAEYE